ncbi:BadF/BadG/BcrA/BcrD ATPase family protein [Synechococcus sp. MIT S9504]|uniref:BadF/BadG/BcrA/BcrD ATPase family protein n=1 Tax=Synechococcus sp. MIT S9504 TaxID=1801628 RepID=UPI0007BB9C9E|nr:BadF/BadG/BcrA/BcrD ATPase family protein [Synechococcus sp. MIT S9504]KZR85672.1 BadF/BadG/BcrA/BcrD ATPase family protein [Synechococcus sp. MIT S9504]
MNKPLPILAGFDAGQTKCRCRLSVWENGKLKRVADGSGPGVSHLDADDGEQRFRSAIRSSLNSARLNWTQRLGLHPDEAEPITAAAIGASGVEVGTPLQARGGALLASELQLPEARCLATGDERTALRGAFPDQAGIVLISGTGMIVVGRDANGREHRCGGWGWRLDGAGSAFDIGHHALQLSVKMADGRAADGPLRQRLWNALSCHSCADLKSLVVSPLHKVADQAKLAPLVDEAAAQGDAAARTILQQSASALAQAVAVTAQALDLKRPSLGARGGALEHLAEFRLLVNQAIFELLPESNWQSASGDACDGALACALERSALKPH